MHVTINESILQNKKNIMIDLFGIYLLKKTLTIQYQNCS